MFSYIRRSYYSSSSTSLSSCCCYFIKQQTQQQQQLLLRRQQQQPFTAMVGSKYCTINNINTTNENEYHSYIENNNNNSLKNLQKIQLQPRQLLRSSSCSQQPMPLFVSLSPSPLSTRQQRSLVFNSGRKLEREISTISTAAKLFLSQLNLCPTTTANNNNKIGWSDSSINNGTSTLILMNHCFRGGSDGTKRFFASKKHKNLLKYAKGYRGRAKNCFRVAIRRVEKAWQYSKRDRKVKHRLWRKLWIMRIQAGVRQYGLRYSTFIKYFNYDTSGRHNPHRTLYNEKKAIQKRAKQKKKNPMDDSDDEYEYDDFIINQNDTYLNTKSHKHNNLNNVQLLLNRKVLAELAANEPFSFKSIVDVISAMKKNETDQEEQEQEDDEDDDDEQDEDDDDNDSRQQFATMTK